MRIDGFIDKGEFKKQIDEWICVFRNIKPASAAAGPLIPGDPEREAEAIRSKEGIPRLGTRRGCLLEIAKKTGITFKLEKGRLAVKRTHRNNSMSRSTPYNVKAAAESFTKDLIGTLSYISSHGGRFCGRPR